MTILFMLISVFTALLAGILHAMAALTLPNLTKFETFCLGAACVGALIVCGMTTCFFDELLHYVAILVCTVAFLISFTTVYHC